MKSIRISTLRGRQPVRLVAPRRLELLLTPSEAMMIGRQLVRDAANAEPQLVLPKAKRAAKKGTR